MTDQQQRPSDEVTAGVVGKWEPDRIVTTEHEGKLVEQVLGEGTAIRLAYVREPTTYTTEIEGDPRDDTGARSIAGHAERWLHESAATRGDAWVISKRSNKVSYGQYLSESQFDLPEVIHKSLPAAIRAEIGRGK